MSRTTTKRLFSQSWLHVPVASAPIGGGMIKLGGGSTWTVVVVATAPYDLLFLACSFFAVVLLAATARYIFSDPDGRASMEWLIGLYISAMISIFTLTPAPVADRQQAARLKNKGVWQTEGGE